MGLFSCGLRFMWIQPESVRGELHSSKFHRINLTSVLKTRGVQSAEEHKPDPEPSVCDEETVTVPLLFLAPKVRGQSLKSVLILQHADRIMNSPTDTHVNISDGIFLESRLFLQVVLLL